MTKVHGVMVTKNEEHRYLKPVLERFLEQVDDVFVLDDQSEDDTAKIAESLGATVAHRIMGPSFTEDESQFRMSAMEGFQIAMKPAKEDWVFCLDADEFLYADDVKFALNCAIGNVGPKKFRVAEVFDVIDDVPYVRTDGFWKDITASRLYNWGDYGGRDFYDKVLGCGSVPWEADFTATMNNDITILHYGYATEEDRVHKYARYFGRPGHSVTHIDSILRTPMLARWQ